MIKVKIKYILTTCLLILAFSSCKKEGCTDESATNYSSEAKKMTALVYIISQEHGLYQVILLTELILQMHILIIILP